MIHAYNKLYLEKARKSLAQMLDFAVYEINQDAKIFFDLFTASRVASLFEIGDANTVAGKSGIELAYDVLAQSGISAQQVQQVQPLQADQSAQLLQSAQTQQERETQREKQIGQINAPSEEYLAGWALAYYQWETSQRFSTINRYVPIKDIIDMYNPYHEMDIKQFSDRMNELILLAKPETNLKMLRKQAGFSQSQLANESGVPVRTIQQYEQRQKNINKAQAEYIFMLASVLKCKPIDLIELVPRYNKCK